MKTRLLALILLISTSPSAFATFINDTIGVEVITPFDTAISDSTTVGSGQELTGSSLIWDYALDVTADSFTLTVSKPYSAGNFTGIFTSIVLSDLDYEVSAVTFNATASSMFSSNAPYVDLNTHGQISLICFPFCAANTPASALSHSFTWDVVFADVPEPSSIALLIPGLIGFGFSRLRTIRA